MAENNSYTPEDVAKILKISRFTVYEMVKRGDLPAYRIGRKLRIEAADLETFKQNSRGYAPISMTDQVKTETDLFKAQDGLVICGQDAILDALTRHLEKKMPNIRYYRSYIGSIDGLLALYRGTANVVTSHLWDGDTDEYNLPYIRRFLPGHKTVIINLVYRMEGFYVAKNNPRGINDWQDLARSELRFVNRERGSGARVLLDEKLRILNIDHQRIQGYENEEMSHLAVASRVARGEADLGLGTEKAAEQVRDIDFIPLQKERYDLVILKQDLNKPHFQSLLEVLQGSNFRNEISGMGGYDVSHMGKIFAGI